MLACLVAQQGDAVSTGCGTFKTNMIGYDFKRHAEKESHGIRFVLLVLILHHVSRNDLF